MNHHAQNKTKFKNILDEFLFEIMEHIHTTYNIWHCDVDYHNIFINENYELKIIDWELAVPFNITHEKKKNPACAYYQNNLIIEGKMAKKNK